MTLQTLTLNLSLNINIGADGQASVSLNTDGITPSVTAQEPKNADEAQAIASTRKNKPAKESIVDAVIVQPTITTPESVASVTESMSKAFMDADNSAPVIDTAEPSTLYAPPPPPPVAPTITPPPPVAPTITPPPPVAPTITPPPPVAPTITPPPPVAPTITPDPMSAVQFMTPPPPVQDADALRATRELNIKRTVADVFGNHV